MIQHINKLFPIILLIILVTGCKQSQFYSIFYEKDLNDSIYTQEQFDILLEKRRNALPLEKPMKLTTLSR